MALTVACTAFLLRERSAVSDLISRLSIGDGIYLLAIALAIFLINALVLAESLRFFDLRLGISEALLLASASTLWSHLPASVGVGIKAMYLKNRLGLSYSQFAAAAVANLFTAVLVGAGLAELAFLLRQQWTSETILLAIGLALLALTCLLPLGLDVPVAVRGKWFDRLRESWSLVRSKPRQLARLGASQALRTLAQAWLLTAAASAVDLPFDAATCLILATLASIALLGSVTPGGLGVREALQTGTAAMIGYPASKSFVVVSLATAAVLVVTFTLGAFSSLVLSRRFTDPRKPDSEVRMRP